MTQRDTAATTSKSLADRIAREVQEVVALIRRPVATRSARAAMTLPKVAAFPVRPAGPPPAPETQRTRR